MTLGRNIKTENTFSVLQEDYQKPILEEEELPPITRIDKVEKKQLKREGKWRFIKYLNEKRKGETLPKSGLP